MGVEGPYGEEKDKVQSLTVFILAIASIALEDAAQAVP